MSLLNVPTSGALAAILAEKKRLFDFKFLPEAPEWAKNIAAWVVPVVLLALVAAIAYVIWRFVCKHRIQVDEQSPLFNEIVDALKLQTRERVLILKVADNLTLGNNIVLFSKPSLWDRFIKSSSSRKDSQAAKSLKDKIFGPPPVTDGLPQA